MIAPFTIVRATAADLPDIFDLLTARGLPLDGLDAHLETTLVARQDGRLVGCVALEVYEDAALLRSVAVAAGNEGQGLGRALTDAAFQLAHTRGIAALYLLTTTAEHYFPKFGFERITRGDVPATVQASVEFTSACPASAIVMRKHLDR